MVLPTGVGVRSSLGLACSKDFASSRATDLLYFSRLLGEIGGARARAASKSPENAALRRNVDTLCV